MKLRTAAIILKETRHIIRDPFTLSLAIFLPLLLVFVFGFAIEFNLKEVPTAILDFDRSQESRQFFEILGSSGYYKLIPVQSPEEGMHFIEAEKAKAIIVVNHGFGRNIHKNNVQLILDGADNSSIQALLGYSVLIQKMVISKLGSSNDFFANERFNDVPFSVGLNDPTDPSSMQGFSTAFEALFSSSSHSFRTLFLYNPELNTHWFIVPGLVVVVMAILGVLLTSLSIAREWESGSMELLLSTPATKLEIIIGKMSPYAVLGLMALVLVYFLARLVFNVPFRGNYLIFILGAFLFLLASLAQGILISVKAKNQQLAMQAAMIASILPATLFSGFVYPIEHMPRIFQLITAMMPARWFMIISRDQFLIGSSISLLFEPFLFLFLLTIFYVFISVKSFKKDLE